jgi:hypothetical protein
VTQEHPPARCRLELDALREIAHVGDGGGGEILGAVGIGKHLGAVEQPAVVVSAHGQDVVPLQELDAAVGIAGAVHDIADDADADHEVVPVPSTSAAARSPARTAPSMKLGSSEVSAPA